MRATDKETNMQYYQDYVPGDGVLEVVSLTVEVGKVVAAEVVEVVLSVGLCVVGGQVEAVSQDPASRRTR